MHASVNMDYQGKSGPGKIHEVILVLFSKYLPRVADSNLNLPPSLKNDIFVNTYIPTIIHTLHPFINSISRFRKIYSNITNHKVNGNEIINNSSTRSVEQNFASCLWRADQLFTEAASANN